MARRQGEAEIGQWQGDEVPWHSTGAQRQEAPLVANVVVDEQAVVLGFVHQVHDFRLDVDDRRLRVELEDLVQGVEVARVDALMQVLKLGAQVVGRVHKELALWE